MAWNPSPDVADCRDIARKWKCDQVVVLAVHSKIGQCKVVSYGETRALCAAAKRVNDHLCKEIQQGLIEFEVE